MDTIEVELAGEIEQGRPLFLSCAVVRIPPEVIDEHELVYRLRQKTEHAERGDLLIVEPRKSAFTGELVIATKGLNFYLGRWWAKNGLRELRDIASVAVEGCFDVIGAVTVIVRP